MQLARDYRGYVWSQWFRQNMTQQWALFAVLLGTGGLLAQASGGGALFTLSLPVSRSRLLGVRAATGLAELLALAVVPSLLLPLLSPIVGERYGLGDALVHAIVHVRRRHRAFQLRVSAVHRVHDVWRPLLIALCAAVLLGLFEQVFRGSGALRPVPRDERRTLLSWWWVAVAGPSGQRGSFDGDVVRGHSQRRAPGFLTRSTRRTLMRAFTRMLLVASLLLVAATSLPAQTGVDPSGHWEGTIHAPNMDVVIGIDLAREHVKGSSPAPLRSLPRASRGCPCPKSPSKGQSIRLLLKPGTGGGTFNGTLSADGKSIAGDFIMAEGGYAVPFTLTRTGAASIAPAPKSPPIAKELEGSWNGTLDAGGRQMRVVVKMANQPDGTATGTIVSVDGTGVEIPIAIAQKGSEVSRRGDGRRLLLRGVERGATEIAGTWTQRGAALPLTLRR